MFRKEIEQVDVKVNSKTTDNLSGSIKFMSKAMEQASSRISSFAKAILVKEASEFEEDLRRFKKS